MKSLSYPFESDSNVFVPSAHFCQSLTMAVGDISSGASFSCVADREIFTVTHAYNGRTLGAERPSQARLGKLLAGRQGCRSRDSHKQSAGPTNRKRMRRTRWLRRSISSSPKLIRKNVDVRFAPCRALQKKAPSTESGWGFPQGLLKEHRCRYHCG
jgi:hypothetical protein